MTNSLFMQVSNTFKHLFVKFLCILLYISSLLGSNIIKNFNSINKFHYLIYDALKLVIENLNCLNHVFVT